MCVAGGHAWWGHVCRGGGGLCMAGACMARGCAWWGACMAGETATTVDSTHPTGMHSCYINDFDAKKSFRPTVCCNRTRFMRDTVYLISGQFECY